MTNIDILVAGDEDEEEDEEDELGGGTKRGADEDDEEDEVRMCSWASGGCWDQSFLSCLYTIRAYLIRGSCSFQDEVDPKKQKTDDDD